MGDSNQLKRHGAGTHEGPAHSSPYPVSRLAPAHDLVDIARQIAQADQAIGTVVNAKLQVIAHQIQTLQAEAREILESARDNAELHRAHCAFQKKVGQTYHLYRRGDGSLQFSMLSPDDWGARLPHTFVGSYRLEADMSWTPAGEAGPTPTGQLQALVGVPDPADSA